MRNSLVLLTYNEIDGVRAVVPRIPAGAADEIVAIDFASTDGTREWLAGQGIRVIPQVTRGRGEAFRLAFESCRGERLLFFSPDGNEDPADIPRMFAALDGADMVIASRFMHGSRNEEDDSALPLRKWVNQAFTRAANLRWNRGPYVTDTINGFRGLRRSAWGTLAPESVGYTIEYELTIRAMKKRLRVVELATREGDRVGGETKGPSLRIGPDFVRLFLRELFRLG